MKLNYREVVQSNSTLSRIASVCAIVGCLVLTACSNKLPNDSASTAVDNSTASAPGANAPMSGAAPVNGVTTQPGGAPSQASAAATCAGGASATYIQQSTGFYPGAQSYFASLGGGWQSWADYASTCNTNVNTAVATLTAQGWPCDGVANTANYVTACVNPLKQALCVAGNSAFCTK